MERAIANLQTVGQQQGLRSYLQKAANQGEEVLDHILDDCLAGLDGGSGGSSFRWLKEPGPRYHCPCSEARVLRALRLLPAEDIQEIRQEGKGVEMKCEFCGKAYQIAPERLTDEELRGG